MALRICSKGRPLASVDSCLSTSTAAPRARSFTTTPASQKQNESKRRLFAWLNAHGTRFKNAPEEPTYLGGPDQPFPYNPLFRSQPVLSEYARQLIWHRVMEQGQPIKAVSALMGIDPRRVAAVVRLKEVEQRMIERNQPLATPYANAIMKMLPQSKYLDGDENITPHEAVNEVLVHKYTLTQLFVPVSESRHFTREDAATAFHGKMLSADARSPQPDLIAMEREVLAGTDRDESMERFRETAAEHEEELAEKQRRQREREQASTQHVHSGRYQFRFKDMKTDAVGRTGRARGAAGWRYGAPHNDRKRGVVKIPTSVP